MKPEGMTDERFAQAEALLVWSASLGTDDESGEETQHVHDHTN